MKICNSKHSQCPYVLVLSLWIQWNSSRFWSLLKSAKEKLICVRDEFYVYNSDKWSLHWTRTLFLFHSFSEQSINVDGHRPFQLFIGLLTLFKHRDNIDWNASGEPTTKYAVEMEWKHFVEKKKIWSKSMCSPEWCTKRNINNLRLSAYADSG